MLQRDACKKILVQQHRSTVTCVLTPTANYKLLYRSGNVCIVNWFGPANQVTHNNRIKRGKWGWNLWLWKKKNIAIILLTLFLATIQTISSPWKWSSGVYQCSTQCSVSADCFTTAGICLLLPNLAAHHPVIWRVVRGCPAMHSKQSPSRRERHPGQCEALAEHSRRKCWSTKISNMKAPHDQL